MAESSKKLKSSYLILSFLFCSNRNRSALVRELLSNNSLFVGQLYEDKYILMPACNYGKPFYYLLRNVDILYKTYIVYQISYILNKIL